MHKVIHHSIKYKKHRLPDVVANKSRPIMLYCAAIYKMSLGRRHKGGNAITLSWKVKKAASPIACSLSSALPSRAWGRGSILSHWLLLVF